MILPAVVLAAAVVSRRWMLIGVAAALAAIGIGEPLLILVGTASSIAGVALRRLRDRRTEVRTNGDDELLAVRVASLGVAAGMGYDQAVQEAAAASGGSVGRALSDSLRNRAAGIREPTGFGVLDAMEAEAHRSELTGARLGPALDALVAAMRRERAEHARTRLARLPVQLLFPLAFLILPGFVLMSVGPAVLSGLARLDL